MAINIVTLKAWRFKTNLTEPIWIKKSALTAREGLFIAFSPKDGPTGIGEISPLPRISRETLEDALVQIEQVHSKMERLRLPDNPQIVRDFIVHLFQNTPLAPSVRFGLEMAILNSLSIRHKLSVAALLSERSASQVPLSGLLQGSATSIEQKLSAYLKQGVSSFKLKLTTPSWQKNRALLMSVMERLPAGLKLRVDLNQGFDVSEVLKTFHQIPTEKIDYVEEPVSNATQLAQFYDQTGLPYALDESLYLTDSLDSLDTFRGLDALVIKPTLLSLQRVLQLIDEVSDANLSIPVIISAAYESPIGLAYLTELASALSPNLAVGLDTNWHSKIRLLLPGSRHLERQSLVGLSQNDLLKIGTLTRCR